MKKVYLDTNILIQGSKKREHDILKKLSQEDDIVLFKSIHGDLEQHGKVIPVLHKKDLAIKNLDKSIFSSDYKEKFDAFIKARTDYEDARKNEQKEKDYWLDSKITRSLSHFNALVVSGLMIPDYKGELKLFDELLNKYKLKDKDAFHVMDAHSSNMNYFLTWDLPLIKKCKTVPWLKMESMTPKDFLIKKGG